jgi:hypothetical protein
MVEKVGERIAIEHGDELEVLFVAMDNKVVDAAFALGFGLRVDCVGVGGAVCV